MIETGTLLQDRYLIEQQIGAGGMGAVFLAVDQRFGSHVAIKETFYKTDEFGDAFEREAHLLNSLHHPALPHVSDYFTEDGGHFLVMQYIEGEDLSEILKREGAFPVSEVLRWTDNLLDALEYLHSQDPPIVHRDIKPQNLKITTRGEIILLDFGLAKLNHEDTTGVKSVFGYSRKYSPLEQIQGTGTDARSDLFSLAATAYHLLTGDPPIDVLARAAEIVVANPDPLKLASEINADVPLNVATILNTALALNAAGRFSSAKQMREALSAHAVQSVATENIQSTPEIVLATNFAGSTTDASESENFPALEAFAAEAITNPAVIENKAVSETPEISASGFQTPVTTSERAPESNSVVEVQTKVISRPKKSRFPLAAAAALLIFVGLAGGYFINKANSANEASANQKTPSISEAAPTPEQSAAVSTEPQPEFSESPALENVEQAKAKPSLTEKHTETEKQPESEKNVETQKNIGKKETSDNLVEAVQPEKAEKPKPAPVRPETAVKRSTARTIPRRSDDQSNGETRDRVVDSQGVPDIEAIFTGRPSGQRNERRQRPGLSDEELREQRRQRREQRRLRQNPLPF